MADLLASIEALDGRVEAHKPPADKAPQGMQAPRRAVPKWALIAGAVLLALVAIGLFVGLVLNDARKSSVVHTVAIAPASPSPTAQSLARDLFAKLGNLHSARAEALKLVQGSPDKADFLFEVDGSNQGPDTSANLVLLGEDRELLWSKDFPQTGQGDLKQQLAFTAAKVLECAVEAVASEGSRLQAETLKLYLNGCSTYSLLTAADPRPLVPIFRAVIERAPRFEGAWAKLIHAEAEIATSGDWQQDADRMMPQLLRDLAKARELNPDMAEVLLAQADMTPAGAIAERMALIERAVERNPESSTALVAYAMALTKVGHAYAAVEKAKRAAQLDPLSPSTRDAVITSLTYNGELEAALEELQRSEQLWPGASNLLAARYRIHLRYGDPDEAKRIQRMGDYGGPHRDAFLEARLDPTPAKIEKAISFPRTWLKSFPQAIGELAQVLGEFGREEDLFAIMLDRRHEIDADGFMDVLFRPALKKFRMDPRMMVVSKRLGLLDYWRNSGKWPDFCNDPALTYDCKAEAAKLMSRPN